MSEEPTINSLDKTVAVIKKTIEDGFAQNSKEHGSLETLVKDIEAKKAGKWVEKVMIAILSAIGMAVVYAFINLVINK